MIILNSLFAYINNKNAFEGSNHTAVISDRVTRKEDFVLYHLETSSPIQVDLKETSYIVDEHHLTFYKTLNDEKYWLSQYHYTAILKNEQNNSYQLHVYFDQQDQLKKVILSKIENEGTFNKITLNEDEAANFAEFAKQNIGPAIIGLREKAQQFYQMLEQEYVSLEKSLTTLSENLEQNHDLYESGLNQVTNVLQRLEPLHEQYQSLLVFFNRMKEAIDRLPSIQRPHIKTETISELSVATPVLLASADVTNTHQRYPFQDAINNAVAMKTAFQSAVQEKSPLVEQTNLAQQFFQLSNEAMLMLDEKSAPVELQDMVTLQKLMSESMRESKRLLEFALLNETNVFVAAKNLKQFVPLISSKFFVIALKKNNPHLLKFLLENGRFAIDTFSIDGQSPVIFCFLKHTETNSRSACLSLLIQHKAAILTNMPDGLPVAHHILKDKSNSLIQAIHENSNITLYDTRFYVLLSKALEKYVKQKNLVGAEYDLLQSYIKTYRGVATTINLLPSFRQTNEILNATAMGTVDILHRLGGSSSAVVVIAEDKDYQSNINQINRLNKEIDELAQHMNKSVFRGMVDSKKQYEKFNDMVTEMISPADTSIGPKKREQRIEFQNHYIDFLTCKVARFQLKALYGDRPMPKNEAKRYNELTKQVYGLLDNLYQIYTLKNYAEESQSEFKSIEQIAQVTQKILQSIKALNKKDKTIKLKRADKETKERETKEELESITEVYHEIGFEDAENTCLWLGRHIMEDSLKAPVQYLKLLSKEDMFDIAVQYNMSNDAVERIVSVNGAEYHVVLHKRDQGYALEFSPYETNNNSRITMRK